MQKVVTLVKLRYGKRVLQGRGLHFFPTEAVRRSTDRTSGETLTCRNIASQDNHEDVRKIYPVWVCPVVGR